MAKTDKKKEKQKIVSSKSVPSVSEAERTDPSSLLRTVRGWISSKSNAPSKTASLSPLSINNHAEEIKEITLTLWDDLFLCIDDFTENAETRQKVIDRINKYYKDLAGILGKKTSDLKAADFLPALEIFEQFKEKNGAHCFNHIRAMFLYVDTLNSDTEWLRQSECLSKPLFYGPFWQPNALKKDKLGYYQPASEEMVEQEALSIFKIAFCDRAVRKSLMRLIVKQLYTPDELENSFSNSLTPILFKDSANLFWDTQIGPAEKFQLIHTSSDACRTLAKNSRPLLVPDEKEFEELVWEIWPKEKNTELLWNNLKFLVSDFQHNADTQGKAVSLITEYYALLKNIKAQQEKKALDQIELKESDLTMAVHFFKSYIKSEEFDIICSMVLYADIINSESGLLNHNYYLSRQLLSIGLWEGSLTKPEDKEKINERIARIFKIAFNNPVAKKKLSPLLLQDLASSESGAEDALKKCIENFTANILFPGFNSKPMSKSDEVSISMDASLRAPSDVSTLKSSEPSTLQKLGDNARKVKDPSLNSTSPLSSNRQLPRRSLSSRNVTASVSSRNISSSSLISTPIEDYPVVSEPIKQTHKPIDVDTITDLSSHSSAAFSQTDSISEFSNLSDGSLTPRLPKTPVTATKSEEEIPISIATVVRISPFPFVLSESGKHEETTPLTDSNIKNEAAEKPGSSDKKDGLKEDIYELVEIIHPPNLGESDDNGSTSDNEKSEQTPLDGDKKESSDESIVSVQDTVEIASGIVKIEATKPPRSKFKPPNLFNSLGRFLAWSEDKSTEIDSDNELSFEEKRKRAISLDENVYTNQFQPTPDENWAIEDDISLSIDPSNPILKQTPPSIEPTDTSFSQDKKELRESSAMSSVTPPSEDSSFTFPLRPIIDEKELVIVSLEDKENKEEENEKEEEFSLRRITRSLPSVNEFFLRKVDAKIDVTPPDNPPSSVKADAKIDLIPQDNPSSSVKADAKIDAIPPDNPSSSVKADAKIDVTPPDNPSSSVKADAKIDVTPPDNPPSSVKADAKIDAIPPDNFSSSVNAEVIVEPSPSSTHLKESSAITAKSGIPYKDVHKHLWIKIHANSIKDRKEKVAIQKTADSRKIDELHFQTSYRDEKNRKVTIKEKKEKITLTTTEVDGEKTRTTFAQNDEGMTDVAISGKCRHTIDQTVYTAKELYAISQNPIFCFSVDLNIKEEKHRSQIETLYFKELLKEGIIPIFEKYKQEKDLGTALQKTYHHLCAKDKGVAAQYSTVISNHSNETLRNAFKTAMSDQIGEEKIDKIANPSIQSYTMKKEVTLTDRLTTWFHSSATEGKKASKKEENPSKSIANSRQPSFFSFPDPDSRHRSSVPAISSIAPESSNSQVIFPPAPKPTSVTLSAPVNVSRKLVQESASDGPRK